MKLTSTKCEIEHKFCSFQAKISQELELHVKSKHELENKLQIIFCLDSIQYLGRTLKGVTPVVIKLIIKIRHETD